MMVGSDLSGIELRILASYLYPYDDGIYVKLLVVHLRTVRSSKRTMISQSRHLPSLRDN